MGEAVRDPVSTAALVPTYPFGRKRSSVDEGYDEAFNRDDVTLIGLRAAGPLTSVECPDSQRARVEHTASLVTGSVIVHPSCTSWWNGGNVPGKKRMFMAYTAGIPEYRRRCDEIAAGGYTGFRIS